MLATPHSQTIRAWAEFALNGLWVKNDGLSWSNGSPAFSAQVFSRLNCKEKLICIAEVNIYGSKDVFEEFLFLCTESVFGVCFDIDKSSTFVVSITFQFELQINMYLSDLYLPKV